MLSFFFDSLSLSLSLKSFRVPVQLEFPFSRSAENREDELFHFISIFLSSAGKVRGRRRTHRYTVVAVTQRRAVRAPRRLLLR